MSSIGRKLESDQCRQVLPIVGCWHVNLVLFCFGGGQVLQRRLVSKFMSSIKCFDLLPHVHAQAASVFCLSQSSRTLIRKREAQGSSCPQYNALTFHLKCTRCRPFLAPISFLWRRRHHTFFCFFLNENKLSRSHSRQIDLRRQGLHSCDLLPCWLRSKVAGVAY